MKNKKMMLISGNIIQSNDRSFQISCKGLSETPLHFIFRYKGDSVVRYRRYRQDIHLTLGYTGG